MTTSSRKSTVAVIGAGAIGGFVAARLAQAGRSVRLCVRTPIPELVLETGGARIVADVEVLSEPDRIETTAEWIFLATKAHETAGAAPWLARLCGATSKLVVLQNGIDAEHRVAHLAGAAQIIPALVYIGAERLSPGRIVQYAGGRLVVPAGESGAALAKFLANTGIAVEQAEDFLTEAWLKILGNVFANPLTTLTMRRVDVFADPDVVQLARKLLIEAVEVGKAGGAKLSCSDVDKLLANIALLPKESGSSMLYDRLAGRRLEHEYLTGAVVRAADELGIDVPFNRAMLTLLRALDSGTRE